MGGRQHEQRRGTCSLRGGAAPLLHLPSHSARARFSPAPIPSQFFFDGLVDCKLRWTGNVSVDEVLDYLDCAGEKEARLPERCLRYKDHTTGHRTYEYNGDMSDCLIQPTCRVQAKVVVATRRGGGRDTSAWKRAVFGSAFQSPRQQQPACQLRARQGS